MKKILHIIESSETGGAENVFLNLIKNINSKKYRPYIGLLYKGWLYDEIIKAGYKPILFPSNGSFDYKLFLALISYIKKNHIDIIHSHLFGVSVYTSMAAWFCGVSNFVTIHGMVDVNERDKFKKLKFAIMNTFSKKVIYVSKALLKYFKDLGLANLKKSEIIYNGIDLKVFNSDKGKSLREDYGLSQKNFIIGAVGDIRPPKGYHILIKAIAIAKDKIPNLMVMIAGSRTPLLKELEELAKKLEVKNNVLFIGFHPRVQDIYKTIDIYVLSSISEGFSLTTAEAMAFQLPIIVTDCGGPTEIITKDQNGIIVEVNNPAAIAEKIFELYENKNLRNKLGYNALKEVKNRFSLEIMINNYYILYHLVT